jgi:uncharacterized protein HemY
MAECLFSLGYHALIEGQHERARARLEEGLALRKEIGDKDGIAYVCLHLGDLAFQQGDYQRALTLCEESLAGYREVGNVTYIAETLSHLGKMARIHGDYTKAATIHETALTISREARDEFAMAMVMDVVTVRAALGEAAFTAAWAQGREMTIEQAIAEALNQ